MTGPKSPSPRREGAFRTESHSASSVSALDLLLSPFPLHNATQISSEPFLKINTTNNQRVGEKQKEYKERAERDDRNQENAGSSYRVPDAADLGPEDDDLSGLPWGSVNSKLLSCYQLSPTYSR